MTALAPTPPADLPDLIERARACLDDGALEAARVLSGHAYDTAKQASALARRVAASDQLLRKAHELQGEALLIEARVQIRMADEVDAGQAAGVIATRGKRKANAENDSISTLDDLGIDRAALTHARKLRDAERDKPGLAERAIAARIAEGLEPTRANLRAAIGTDSASREDRGDNLYQTPIEAIAALLALERFAQTVLEPACGRGAISGPLEAAGYDVILSDINDYGTADRHGECQTVVDFLDTDRAWLAERQGGRSPQTGVPASERPAAAATLKGGADIVTNPPYGAVINAFIRHALETFRPRKMAMLCNLNVLAGFDDPDRSFFLDRWPPARIHVFTRRLPMMHRDGWEGNQASSRMNTCWLVWEAATPPMLEIDPDRPYGRETRLNRIDWKEFQDAAPLAPGGAA
ncbi:SAM-dependent methyltransferase [Oceaniradius stylonematis]|uniref:SAM-dependent methyltransferase n=1 Tax=Oceaniradius stylonematis TaxID=2184161 RepID=UPI003B5A725B